MRKILVLVLAFAILLSFGACANDTDIRGKQSTPSPTTATTDEPSSETPATTDTNPTAEPEFSLGTTTGLTYENDFIGIGCTLDSDWTFYSDEEIKTLNNIATDMAGEEYAELMKDAAVVYDMYASASNQMDNINVNLEKVNLLQLVALDIAKNYEALLPTLNSTFENMGYTGISNEIGTIEIDGQEFTSLSTEAEINGVKMYQRMFAVKCNGYLANITVTTYFEDTTESILANFYLV